jgi:hypothetical protein
VSHKPKREVALKGRIHNRQMRLQNHLTSEQIPDILNFVRNTRRSKGLVVTVAGVKSERNQ